MDRTPETPRSERELRREQVAMYFGLGPEPVDNPALWFDWIETVHMHCEWKDVPEDWKPGDPTDADLDREAKRLANEAIEKAKDAARRGPAPK